MTLGEFRAKTAELPDSMDLMIVQTDDENHFGYVQQAYVHEVTFKAPDIPKKEWAPVDCLVITDEISW